MAWRVIVSAAGRRRGFLGLLGAILRLGLRGRFERGFADRWLVGEPGIAEKARDTLGRLRPDPEPMLDPLFLQGDPVGVAASQNRVGGAKLLDKAPVARAARIGDDDRIERPLLSAAAGKP